MKLYKCTFLDAFSEKQMTICDLPTNKPSEIVDIINDYGMPKSGGWEFMTVLNGLIEIKQQQGFEELSINSNTIKYINELTK